MRRVDFFSKKQIKLITAELLDVIITDLLLISFGDIGLREERGNSKCQR